VAIEVVRPQLEDRRRRLEAAAGHAATPNVADLLAEVDAALQRIEDGTYGNCEVCHDPIEPERLRADPLMRFCLDHLSEPEMRAHEQDLELATQIQYKLLPPSELSIPGWRTHYYYQAAGPVGGDFCELARLDDGSALFFAIGDVAGKGNCGFADDDASERHIAELVVGSPAGAGNYDAGESPFL
jgi:sigma-B regulation protein RsbU (phosphoserine phosphatase)